MSADARSRATELAAQCWCQPTTSGIEMDTRLAEAIVDAILKFSAEQSAQARRENESLSAQCKHLIETRRVFCERFEQGQRDLAKRDAEIAELRLDKERIDAIQTLGLNIRCNWQNTGYCGGSAWDVFVYASNKHKASASDSGRDTVDELRAVIDAARKDSSNG